MSLQATSNGGYSSAPIRPYARKVTFFTLVALITLQIATPSRADTCQFQPMAGLRNPSAYSGECRNGLANGHGAYTGGDTDNDDGHQLTSRIEGTFANGLQQGDGTYVALDGTFSFKGIFTNGFPLRGQQIKRDSRTGELQLSYIESGRITQSVSISSADAERFLSSFPPAQRVNSPLTKTGTYPNSAQSQVNSYDDQMARQQAAWDEQNRRQQAQWDAQSKTQLQGYRQQSSADDARYQAFNKASQAALERQAAAANAAIEQQARDIASQQRAQIAAQSAAQQQAYAAQSAQSQKQWDEQAKQDRARFAEQQSNDQSALERQASASNAAIEQKAKDITNKQNAEHAAQEQAQQQAYAAQSTQNQKLLDSQTAADTARFSQEGKAASSALDQQSALSKASIEQQAKDIGREQDATHLIQAQEQQQSYDDLSTQNKKQWDGQVNNDSANTAAQAITNQASLNQQAATSKAAIDQEVRDVSAQQISALNAQVSNQTLGYSALTASNQKQFENQTGAASTSFSAQTNAGLSSSTQGTSNAYTSYPAGPATNPATTGTAATSNPATLGGTKSLTYADVLTPTEQSWNDSLPYAQKATTQFSPAQIAQIKQDGRWSAWVTLTNSEAATLYKNQGATATNQSNVSTIPSTQTPTTNTAFYVDVSNPSAACQPVITRMQTQKTYFCTKDCIISPHLLKNYVVTDADNASFNQCTSDDASQYSVAKVEAQALAQSLANESTSKASTLENINNIDLKDDPTNVVISILTNLPAGKVASSLIKSDINSSLVLLSEAGRFLSQGKYTSAKDYLQQANILVTQIFDSLSTYSNYIRPSGSIWNSANVLERGIQMESRILGRTPNISSIAPNFPVIDDFLNGVGTSIKSIDLKSPSYADVGRLKSVLTGYVESLRDFQEASLKSTEGLRTITVQAGDMTQKVLRIGIEPNAATSEQEEVLKEIADEAEKIGILIIYVYLR